MELEVPMKMIYKPGQFQKPDVDFNETVPARHKDLWKNREDS